MTLPSLVGTAISIAEIESTESGRPRRKDVNRLLRKLRQKTPYYRRAWSQLLRAWFSAQKTGEAVARDEMMRPKETEKSVRR